MISARDLPELRRMLYTDCAAYSFPVRNYSKWMDLMWRWTPNDGSYPREESFSGCPGSWGSVATRLFRNVPGVSFRTPGSNHTRPDESLARLGLPVVAGAVRIHNLGCVKGGDRYLAAKNAERLRMEQKNPHKDCGDYANIARTCLFLGRDAEARDALEQALRLRPGYQDALYLLGLLGKESGELDLAADALLRLLALNPEHADGWTILGMVLDMQGRAEEAEGALRRALVLQPGHPLAWNSLGIALESQGRFPDAEFAYRRALEIHPEHPYAWHNLATLCESLGLDEEALDARARAEVVQKEQFALLAVTPVGAESAGCEAKR